MLTRNNCIQIICLWFWRVSRYSVIRYSSPSLTELHRLIHLLPIEERIWLMNISDVKTELELAEVLNATIAHGATNAETDVLQVSFEHYLLLYVPPVLIAVGSFGNIISFIILRRQPMAKVSFFLYLASLAITDSLVLYVGLLRWWLIQLIGVDFYVVSDWVCKLANLGGYMVSDVSVWLIIAVTVERYIVVCYPLRASTMCNTRRARVVIGFLVILMFAINMHFFWTVEIVERPRDGKNVVNCEAAAPHTHLVNEIWPWVDAFIYSFFPFVIILVLNILIIVEVVAARNHRQNMSTNHFHQQVRRKVGGLNPPRRKHCGPGESTKMTFMLLTVSFTFLLTTLPMNVWIILTPFWNQQQYEPNKKTALTLGRTICELLMYLNHSINFFLYCATGQKFRKQIAHLLSCRHESHSSWTSVHTEPFQMSTVKFGSTESKKHVLVATTSEDLSSNETEMFPLKTKV